jgi:hypothetical protein
MTRMDLFKPTTAPKDLAISRAIEQAVEMLISDDIEGADHCFEMAQEFARAPSELFAPTTNA